MNHHLFRCSSLLPSLLMVIAIAGRGEAGLPIHSPQFQPIHLGRFLLPVEEVEITVPEAESVSGDRTQSSPGKLRTFVNSIKSMPWIPISGSEDETPEVRAIAVEAGDNRVTLTKSTTKDGQKSSTSRLESLLRRMGYQSE
ncbi:hypothetical protein AB1L42_15155 [Thalassoglobus sp. JC818]|uniref:hypothetical protein n=1 Tax=Thalassoglobus sp. JC818 TaxID=3232136 RepID=UPI00345ABBE8